MGILFILRSSRKDHSFIIFRSISFKTKFWQQCIQYNYLTNSPSSSQMKSLYSFFLMSHNNIRNPPQISVVRNCRDIRGWLQQQKKQVSAMTMWMCNLFIIQYMQEDPVKNIKVVHEDIAQINCSVWVNVPCILLASTTANVYCEQYIMDQLKLRAGGLQILICYRYQKHPLLRPQLVRRANRILHTR